MGTKTMPKNGSETARRRFLVPVDGSRCALRAVEVALRGLAPGAAEIHLLYVHAVPPFYETPEAYRRRPENRRFIERSARNALEPAARILEAAGAVHRAWLRFGDAAPEIARTASRLKCEAIVMGSRGMGGVRNLLLGSTAMKVIHLAGVPVTVVK